MLFLKFKEWFKKF